MFYIYCTKQLQVSGMYRGHLQGFASTCTAYMELVIDHCILTILHYIYSVSVITDKLHIRCIHRPNLWPSSGICKYVYRVYGTCHKSLYSYYITLYICI